MKKTIILILLSLFALAPLAGQALNGPFEYQGRQYYIVNSENQEENTGDKVCAKAELKCLGYTALNTEVCKHFHPDAKLASGMDGSKNGFYCNGAPQQGVCSRQTNTCNICPACNLNADCSYVINDFFREMYVECGQASVDQPAAVAAAKTTPAPWANFLAKIKAYLQSIKNLIAGKLKNSTTVTVKQITVGPYPGKWACEFLQAPWPKVNKKSVTCAAPMAADNWCKLAYQSPHAKAEVCADNGLIICSNPCIATPAQIMPKTCPFDNDRPRGNQAAPLSWCD